MSESVTLRLRDRRWFRRSILRLEVNHDPILVADTVDVHEALVRVAIDNPDLLLQKLAEVQDDPDYDSV